MVVRVYCAKMMRFLLSVLCQLTVLAMLLNIKKVPVFW